MKTTCQFENPDEMEVTITITTSLAHWRKISDLMQVDLDARYFNPYAELRREISDVIRKVQHAFISSVSATGEDDAS